MTANDGFFQKQKPAAVLKHAVLAEYCKVFTSMIGSRHRGPVWLIDGYAGPGSYDATDDDTQPRDGSPLVAMKLAREWRNAKSSRDLRGAFIEADPVKAARLRRNLAPFQADGLTAIVLEGAVENQLPTAWQQVSQAPVVTFLDPFGVAMPSDLMTNILLAKGRRLPSEVLLNINVEAVSRLGGCLERRDGQVVAKPGQEKGVERVDRFLGDTWWRSKFYEARSAGAGSAAAAAAAVVRQHRERVEQATGCTSMSIPVLRAPHHVGALFDLTLFFRHPVAGYKFADAASRATRKWRAAYQEQMWASIADEPTLFGSDQIAEWTAVDTARREESLAAEWVQTIADNIKGLLESRESLPLSHNILAILGSTLAFAGEEHIRKAWDMLADEKIVQMRDTKGPMYKKSITKR